MINQKNEKCLIIQPPFYKSKGSHNNRINLTLHTLNEILNQFKHPSQLINLDHLNNSRLSNRIKIYKNQPNIQFINNEWPKIKHAIETTDPHFIIFSTIDWFIPFFDTSSKTIITSLAQIIKSHFPYIKTICLTHEHFKDPAIDFTYTGHSFYDLLSQYFNTNTDKNKLDFLPHLTLDHLLSPKPSAKDFDLIYSSMGCQYQCSFCSSHFFNNSFYMRRLNSLFKEIIFRTQNYHVNDYYFTDCVFNYDTQFLKSFHHQKNKNKLEFQYKCECRIDHINEEQLHLLSQTGCHTIKLGIESMNNKRLKQLSKQLTVDQIIEKFKIIKNYNIKTVVYILLGPDQFSEKDYLKELSLFKKLNSDFYTVSILNPFPGSLLHSTRKIPKFLFDEGHLSQKTANFWKLSGKVIESFFDLEKNKGREDHHVRKFHP